MTAAAESAAIRGPDFFIVGAPKCGTTALNVWLSQHPDVFMAPQKEAHFFGSDLDLRRRSPFDTTRYGDLFRDATVERRVGEASTFYLFSRRAAREIHAFHSEARIIVMLRNPVDVMHSYHSERLYRGTEDVRDFETALALETERRAGRHLPTNLGMAQGVFYRDIASFSDQVERYLRTFGRDRVHVVIHDDLRRSPKSVFEQVCKFLDIDPRVRVELPVVNANKQARSAYLRELVRPKTHPAFRAARRVVPSRLRARLRRELIRLNTRHVERPSLSPALRERLAEEFTPEVERLCEILGRDLRHWCQPSSRSSARVGHRTRDRQPALGLVSG